MNMRVIIFGATGMVGEGVLLEALRDERVEAVLVVGRRSCVVTHPKLRELIHRDFFNYDTVATELSGYQACFFCLGVSSIGMNEAEYTRLTYDLTMRAARTLSSLNPGMTFCYVSGMGTSSTGQGRVMWARVKGRTENQLSQLPFRAVFLFRPGLIRPTRGQRNVPRLLWILGLLFPLFKFLFPLSICTMEALGRAMINSADIGYVHRILENRDISILAASGMQERLSNGAG